MRDRFANLKVKKAYQEVLIDMLNWMDTQYQETSDSNRRKALELLLDDFDDKGIIPHQE